MSKKCYTRILNKKYMNKKYLAGILGLVSIALFVGYVSTRKTPPVPLPDQSLKTYTNTQFGFSVQYPYDFFVTQGGPNSIVATFSQGNGAWASPQNVRIEVVPASNSADVLQYLSKYPVLNPNSGQPFQFTKRSIAGRDFYFTQTERFEGVLSYAYYTLQNGKIFIFTSISRGVDWTNQNLDVENDPAHLVLKNMLETLEFSSSLNVNINPSLATSTISIKDWKLYQNIESGYLLKYPADFPLQENIQGKPGEIVFTFPPSFTYSTNLGGSTADSYISIETRPENKCDFGTLLDVPQGLVRALSDKSIQGALWTGGMTTDAGAGNFYSTTVYKTSKYGACYNVRLFIHSVNINNYDPGTVKAYDEAKVNAIYNAMLASFKFTE